MRFFLLFLLVWVPAQAFALQTLTQMYQARVAVTDQSEEQRAQAVRTALATVLVRVSGDAAIAESPAAQALLSEPARHLQGASYESVGDALRLRVTFNGLSLAAAMSAAGLPQWSAKRPRHLLWLALDGGSPRLLFENENESEDAEAIEALKNAADVRGLPLLLPQGDAADADAVKPADVFVGEAEPLLRASRRYAADQVVTVWAAPARRTYSLRWSLFHARGLSHQWESSAPTLGEALAAGLDALADHEARQFAVQAAPMNAPAMSAGENLVEVQGIATLADYARTLASLKSLTADNRVEVASVSAGRALFRLRAEGGDEALARRIAASGVLREEPSAARATGARLYSLLP